MNPVHNPISGSAPTTSSDSTDATTATAAAAASTEENIYIPSFISQRPFYAGEGSDSTTDYLEHQRKQKKQDDSKWYDRGKKAGPAATKFRKGACENCGAMTHKAKDCLSRPRAKGAKWTGKDIQADEVVQDVQLSWDAKRDRWNGFDAKEYRQVVDEYNQMEELRKEIQEKQAEEEQRKREEDGFHYAEESDMSRHQPTSTKQLRIREDTAKYLLSLNPDSATYNPKTRSLVDGGKLEDAPAKLFAEANFLNASGESAAFEKLQKYAWEIQEQTGDISKHAQANPTAGALAAKKAEEEADRKKQERERMLLDMYGATPAEMPKALKDMALAESERFVEYDEVGLIKGGPTTVARSKYPEDVFPGNHSSVWGSWWSDFKWGYACCHSFIKNSYCTGEDGKRAWEEADRHRTGANLVDDREAEEGVGGDEVAAEKEAREKTEAKSARKRTVGEMMGGVTEEEMDEYRRKKAAADDPMAKYLGKDELVH